MINYQLSMTKYITSYKQPIYKQITRNKFQTEEESGSREKSRDQGITKSTSEVGVLSHLGGG
jgi:hypothetical protein